MHIETGVVQGAKMLLSYATAAASFGIAAKLAVESMKDNGLANLAIKSLIATVAVFIFFEVFPHTPVGVSEVHLILGSTLFLLFGLAPTAIGLSAGLLIQGLFFAPFDIPQYGINVTTLLAPLFVMSLVAKKIIPSNIAYKDIAYKDALKLSLIYQGGIVTWVAFWVLYGQGFGAISEIMTFGVAYMSVVAIEPLIDLAVLYFAKNFKNELFIDSRVFRASIAK